MAASLKVLGELEVWCDGARRPLVRRQIRILLGALALRANSTVTTAWLTEALWAGRPPRSAPANLRSYLAAIRRVPAGTGAEDLRLESGQGRHLLLAGPASLDLLAFEQLTAQGRRQLTSGRAGTAADRLDRALALWRGPVLEGLRIPEVVQPEVRTWEDLRVDAIEDWADASLAAARHVPVAAQLHGLVQRYPLRERLWAQLMLALYRCGRPADALATYRELFALLDVELGIRPNRSVHELHQRILREDPVLDSADHRPGLPARDIGIHRSDSRLERSVTPPGVAGSSGPDLVTRSGIPLKWPITVRDAPPDSG